MNHGRKSLAKVEVRESGKKTAQDEIEKLAVEIDLSTSWKKHINGSIWVLRPKDAITQAQFSDYISKNQSVVGQLVLNVVFILYSVLIIVKSVHEVAVHSSASGSFPGSVILCVGTIVLTGVVYLSGWLFFAVLLFRNRVQSTFWAKLENQRLTIQWIWQVSFTLACVSFMTARTMSGHCSSTPLNGWRYDPELCNNFADDGIFPPDTFLIMTMTPFLSVTILRETRIAVIGFCWLAIIASLSVCVIHLASFSSLTLLIIYVILSPMILVDILRSSYQQFYINQRLEKAIRDNEEMAAAERANEMRHMIANVAHDLKTVSLFFLVFHS